MPTTQNGCNATEELLPYPHNPASIEQDQVDLIVKVDRVGDAAKIGAGATRMTTNPRELLIARSAADVIVNSARSFKEGCCPCKPAPAAHRWR